MGDNEPLRSPYTLNWGVFDTLAVLKLLIMSVCDVILMKYGFLPVMAGFVKSAPSPLVPHTFSQQAQVFLRKALPFKRRLLRDYAWLLVGPGTLLRLPFT